MEESGFKFRTGMTVGFVGGIIGALSPFSATTITDNNGVKVMDYRFTYVVLAVAVVVEVIAFKNLYESGRLTKKAGWLLQGGKPR